MARGRKMSMGSIEEKIAKQKLQLEKSKKNTKPIRANLLNLLSFAMNFRQMRL